MAAGGVEPHARLLEQWGGPMFIRDKRGTKPSAKLTSLLTGIANTISSVIEKSDHGDITPPSLAAFYRACGGDYDQLFIHMPPQSISFIYARLECPHSLQPLPTSSFSPPIIPALKPFGYVRWQTIQLLLGPEEHVPFIQNALLHFDVREPETGKPFLKEIPTDAFPSRPDPDMVAWHDSISNSLKIEAEEGVDTMDSKHQEPTAEPVHEEPASTDERADAAHFFANPLYKNKEGRPAIVRQLTKAPAKMLQSGKLLAGNMFQSGKMILSPNTFGGPPPRRKSHSPSPTRGHNHDGHRVSSIHSNKYMSEMTGSAGGKRTPASPRPGQHHSHRASLTPNSSDDADKEAESEAYEQDRRRRRARRRSHDSRGTPDFPDDFDGLRRHRSVDYRQGRQQQRPRNVSSGSNLNPQSNVQSDDRRSGYNRPQHSPPLATRVQERQHRDAHRGDYFGSNVNAGQYHHVPNVRPSMPYRTTSEQNLYDKRRAPPEEGGYVYDPRAARPARGPQDNFSPKEARHNGDVPGMATGVRFSAPFGGQQQLHSENEAGETSSGQDRRGSMAKNVAPVNGVKGRRYLNEAPWDCEG